MSDPRDEIWSASFNILYDSLYQEIVADRLVKKWQQIDALTRVLVALTASSSAVAGWALWTKPEVKPLWIVVSGFAAVLSIIHATLGVPDRIKQFTEDEGRFLSLRTQVEALRYKMRINAQFDVESFTSDLLKYLERFAEYGKQVRNDLLRTQRLEEASQSQVNKVLAKEINEG